MGKNDTQAPRAAAPGLLVLILVILALSLLRLASLRAEAHAGVRARAGCDRAVQKKDADRFRHYVNLDLVTSRGYDDLTADLLSYDTTLTAVNKTAYEKFYITVKPQLTSGTQDTILRRRRLGRVEPA